MDGDPNHLIGPIYRSDVVSLSCLGAAGYLIANDRWPAIVGLALVIAMFSGFSPRLKGHWGFQWGQVKIGATFVAPKTPRLHAATPTRRLEPAQAQTPAPEARHTPQARSRGSG